MSGLYSKASIKSVRTNFILTYAIVEDPETEEIRFEINSEIKDLEDHQLLAFLKKANGRVSTHQKIATAVHQDALELTQ